MADNQEPGKKQSSADNIFEKFGSPTGSSGQLEGIQSAIKSLADSLTEMRSEVNSLKRPADVEISEESPSSKRVCAGDVSCSDSESVGCFFAGTGAAEGDDDDDDDDFSLMDFFEDENETGAAISDQLAVLSNKALRVPSKEEKVTEIKSKHKRPSNVDCLQVPMVNDQLWRQLPPQVKALDFLLQKTQKNYSLALVPVLKAMDELKKEGHPKMKELIGDTFKLLTNAFVTTSQVRRDRIRKELLPLYRSVCKAEPSTAHLFGDKVEEELKKVRDNKQQITHRRPFLGKRQGMTTLGPQHKRHAFGSSSNMNFSQQRQRQPNYRSKQQKKNNYQSRAQRK